MSFCVFIPGIQGSKLTQGNIPRFPVLRKEAMEHLTLNADDSPMDTEELYTVLGFDVYETIDTYFRSQFGVENFHHFTYDWRFELNEHFESLYSILHNKSEIIIVAHSMGGILTKLFLHWCEDKGHILDISKIYTLGTPWQGSAESIYMLKYGSGFPKWYFKKIPSVIGLATADIMRNIANSFPSVFQLLPHDNYIDNISPVLYNSDKSALSAKDTYLKLLDPQQYNYYLNYSQTIQSELSSSWPIRYEGIHTAIIGHNLCTLGSIVLDQNVSGGKVNKKRLQWVSGDKTVPVSSGEPLFECNKLYIKKDHLGLAQDRHILEFIATDCGVEIESPTEWKHQYSPSSSYSGRSLRIACPVSVSISSNGTLLGGEIDIFDSVDDLLKLHEPEQTNTYRIDDSYFIFIDDEEDIEESHKNNYEEDITLINENLELEITSYDKGLASIEIDRYEDGILLETKIFEGLELTEETMASLTFEDFNDIKTAQLVRTTGQKEEEVNGYTLNPVEIERINHPITTWKITDEFIGEYERLKFYNKNTLNIKIEDVSNVDDVDILEYRYILNGNLYQSNTKNFNITAINGQNTLTVFTIAKNGYTDIRPKSLQFEIGNVEFDTYRKIVLMKEGIIISFNANSNTRDDMFKVTYVLEENGDYLPRPGFSSRYPKSQKEISFYTLDKHKNKGKEEVLVLPDINVRDVIFTQAETVKDISNALGINNIEKWELKINGRKIKSPDTSITSKTRKVELLLDETVYIIVFEDEFELFWQKGSELITSGANELEFTFTIKSSSSGTTMHMNDLDSIKIKVYSKDKIELPVEMEIIPLGDFFTTTLVVSQLPEHVDKGFLKVFVNDRPAREIKFVFN
ncbi:alpha/beta hydrolase [Paenibacillus sp. FSL R7-269]|uniref:lipase/acyltransferase domain-containing protein n=1 Tax=Paenibacillus sp. FSL R7-269 TaxID=1226755 RepID=UPI0003E1DB55|nr:hypothetical protein [Paenibacillus sp. FSL R7-269]ETT55412.1 alpha/beta hydrolase [Paenibacillus sp. FSL R7-269]